MSTLVPGARVRITSGTFRGFSGVITEVGDQVRVEIEIFGRVTPVTVDPVDVSGGDPTDPGVRDEILGELAAAASRRALLGVELMRFWAREVLRVGAAPDEATQLAIADRFEVLRSELDQRLARERDALHARYEAELAPLPPPERLVRWAVVRREWTDDGGATERARAELEAEIPRDRRVATRWGGEADVHDVGRQLQALVAQAAQRRERGKHPLTRTIPPAVARDPEMEAALLADPDDDARCAVYADWLQAQGDPSGEIAALEAAGLTADAARARKAHADALLGSLVAYDDVLTLTWRHGFVDTARIALTYDQWEEGIDVPLLLTVLLTTPSARFLRSLTLGVFDFEGDTDFGALIDVIAAKERPFLRHLFVGDTTAEEQELSWTRAGDLSALPEALPNLRELKVRAGAMTLGSLDFPCLEELVVETGGLSADSARAIAAGTWPRLHTLEVWFGSRFYGGEATAQDVEPLLQGRGVPALSHLGLRNAEITDDLCARLPTAPILPRLRTLDLSMGTMSDAGAHALAAHPERLRHLEWLDVTDSYLTEEGIAALGRIGVPIRAERQRQPDTYGGGLDRYVSVGE